MPRLLVVLCVVSLGCAKPPDLVGTGDFALAATLDGASYPQELAAGDFDGDGVTTLVVSAIPPFTYELQGDTWRQGSLPVPRHASPILAADLDDDGKPELIVNAKEALGPSNELSWTTKRTWAPPKNPVGIAMGQLVPGEGVELVVSSEDDGASGSRRAQLAVLPRAGGSIAHSNQPFPGACRTPAIVDFDGDGAGQLVCSSYVTSQMLVTARGGERLEQPRVFEPGAVLDSIVACDLDGDGRQEALVSLRSQGTAAIRRGADGGFEVGPLLTTGQICTGLACEDLDADGDVEVVSVCDGELRVLDVGADGASTRASFSVTNGFGLLHADVTNDGVKDLVVPTLEENGKLHVFRALTRAR